MNLGMLALMLPLVGGGPEMLPPPPMVSQFTSVRVLGPEGSKTTWYPATPLAVSTANVDPVALRPGYVYRFELAQVGENKRSIIWPSIEVRGSLVARPEFHPADHPIRIVFSDDDIERILEGRFVTRYYFLEDPQQAVNGPNLPGIPLEFSSGNEFEALKEARARGRLMIIVRAGERLWTPEELVRENVPGSIWLPKTMPSIPIPVAPPCLPYDGIPLFDPLLGPKQLTGECLFDGGDRDFNLGIGKENKVYGLDPSDTSMEFTTAKGRKVTTSNRVCICVPRFAAMRVEVSASGHHGFNKPKIEQRNEGQQIIVHNRPPLAVESMLNPVGATGQVKPNALITEEFVVINQALIGRAAAIAKIDGLLIAAQLVEPNDLTVYPDCDMTLIKRMDPPHPKRIGEVVTFYLRYRNPTNQTMTDVVISDSLTGRLEFIEGSAKSDRAATFTNVGNEAGSVIVRWAIDGKLLPGQSGTVLFQARIK